MLVDVIFMRREGVKRTGDELRQARPMRAEIVVMSHGSDVNAVLTFPWRGPASPGDRLPKLNGVKLHRLCGAALVLHGGEFVGENHARHLVPQAWWCTILPESERPATTTG